jgi:hypothetical protein
MSVPYAVVFLAMAAACGLLACVSGSLAGRVLLANAGLSLLLVGIAYAGAGPRLLAKRPDGTIPVWSRLLHWPYLLLSRLCFEVARRCTREPPWHEIVPGLYLGRRLTRREGAAAVASLGLRGVLDLTCEFAEPRAMRRAVSYRLLATLDNTSPTLEQLRAGVDWTRRHLPEGSVYVHCAVGHGRSATIVAACLLAAGHAATAERALSLIQARRPLVRPNHLQLRTLRQYAAEIAGGPAGA